MAFGMPVFNTVVTEINMEAFKANAKSGLMSDELLDKGIVIRQ